MVMEWMTTHIGTAELYRKCGAWPTQFGMRRGMFYAGREYPIRGGFGWPYLSNFCRMFCTSPNMAGSGFAARSEKKAAYCPIDDCPF